ncbi:MAG: hypothetical protein IJW62_05185, partial [Clostridia bacterium]|nr:hypothetical protein [Clostridia bacterium]
FLCDVAEECGGVDPPFRSPRCRPYGQAVEDVGPYRCVRTECADRFPGTVCTTAPVGAGASTARANGYRNRFLGANRSTSSTA